ETNGIQRKQSLVSATGVQPQHQCSAVAVLQLCRGLRRDSSPLLWPKLRRGLWVVIVREWARLIRVLGVEVINSFGLVVKLSGLPFCLWPTNPSDEIFEAATR